MKNGKFETQKEIFEALLRGEKITCTELEADYCFLSPSGFVVHHTSGNSVLAFSYAHLWSIYQEPKKKKTIEVKFYRYHFQRLNFKNCYEIIESTNSEFLKLGNITDACRLLKTEERIEIYEVDET